MSVEEDRFRLLMSEKEFADTQIGGFFDLQVKVLTFLGAAVILLGWLYSEKPRVIKDDAASSTHVVRVKSGGASNTTPVEIGQHSASSSSSDGNNTMTVILLALVIIGCSVMLQGITMYGTSLGYLEYKMTTLNEQFRIALSLPKPPFTLLGMWRSSPTQPPVALASVGLFAMHIVVNVVLLCVAFQKAKGIDMKVAVAGTALYELLTIWAEVLVMVAFWKLMRHAPEPCQEVAAT